MSFLLRYWYIIILALVLSLGSAVGVLMMTKDQWLPVPVDPHAMAVNAATDLVEMSVPYLNWNYETTVIEQLRLEYAAEAESIEKERRMLEALRKQVEADVQEMVEMRAGIDKLREEVTKEFVSIEDSELDNLKRLAKVYEGMKPVPVVELFKEMELELVVKLIVLVTPEAAYEILAEMSSPAQGPETLRTAVTITEELRKLKK